jgi:Kyakuja-Dileera-Zisupton transposase
VVPLSTDLDDVTDPTDSMKYPLAVVDRLLHQYGSNIGLGYNIMCAFIKMLMQSSLGAKAVTLCLHGVVPAFHSHTHN